MTASFRTPLAIGTAKTATKLISALRLGAGSNFPGKLARWLDPDVLTNLASQVREQSVAVTGTNGKTTTCGLLAQFIRESKRQVVHNQLGANMVPGITAALLNQSSMLGRLNADIAVLEVDEASLKGITREVATERVLVTNLFRDQLDRYGELDTTARMIQAGIGNTAIVKGRGRLILNADDPLVYNIAKNMADQLPPDALMTYGIESVRYKYPVTVTCPVPFPKESNNCPRCEGTLSYGLSTLGHLGHFHCPQCGFARPTPDVRITDVLVEPEGSDVTLVYGRETCQLRLALPGLFNVYNLLSAAAMAFDLGVPASCLQAGLDHYTGVFGRAERKSVHGKDVMIMLIKNPTGASEVLKLVGSDPNGRLLIAINDNYADGRDISWLWDAMFEAIQPSKPIIVSGHRAHDMAVRLKYAGIPDSGMTTVPDLKEAVQRSIEATQPGETLYILPTYTALLDLRFIL